LRGLFSQGIPVSQFAFSVTTALFFFFLSLCRNTNNSFHLRSLNLTFLTLVCLSCLSLSLSLSFRLFYSFYISLSLSCEAKLIFTPSARCILALTFQKNPALLPIRLYQFNYVLASSLDSPRHSQKVSIYCYTNIYVNSCFYIVSIL